MKSLGLLLAVLLLAACIALAAPVESPVALSESSESSVVSASWPAPVLGVVVDAENRVVAIDRDSAAEAAGLQQGDILLDVRLADEALAVARSASAPFTDPDAAHHLIGRSSQYREGVTLAATEEERLRPLPLKLRVQRGKQVMELDITPTRPRTPPGEPAPTPVYEPFNSF